MPRKTKSRKPDVKQSQRQEQKIVVNVGDVKRRRKRKAKRRAPSQAATEYAEAISQVIPRIQYNFPQHSSFNYDAYRTPEVAPKGVAYENPHPISLEAPLKLYQTQALKDQLKPSRVEPVIDTPKPQPDLLPIRKPVNPEVDYPNAIERVDKYNGLADNMSEISQTEPLYRGLQKTSSPFQELESTRITSARQPPVPVRRIGIAPVRPRKPSEAVLRRYAEAFDLSMGEAETQYAKRVELGEPKTKIRKEVDKALKNKGNN